MGSTLTVDNIQGASASSKVAIPGHVIRTEQVEKTDVQTSSTSFTFLDISGLTLTLTPTAATSKFFITFLVRGSSNYFTTYVKLLRGIGGTFTELGANAAGAGDNRLRIASAVTTDQTPSNNHGIMHHNTFQLLDAPNTTSAVTYKLQMAGRGGGSNLMYINRTVPDRTQGEYDFRSVSYLTVMEIGG
tara:strand:+ start:362 stop:925 length:564 start_codon:yes stop_codon:yes gene_type:complete